MDLSLEIREMITGFWVSQAIYVAAKLDLAERIGSEEKTVSDLAEECHAYPEMLYRLMRALASRGIFQEVRAGVFAGTPKSDFLRTSFRGSLRYYALMYGEESYRNFSSLFDAVKTGEVPFEKNFGAPFFQYLANHPTIEETFKLAMADVSHIQASEVAQSFPFSQLEHLVDVGGGSGTLLFEVMRQHPQLRGTLFDFPQVIQKSKENIEPDLSSRCQFVSGDFFRALPPGADAYLFKYIFHDWNDNACLQILEVCRNTLSEKAKLLIIDQVIPPGNERLFAKFADLHMHLILGGKERTAEEFHSLLDAGGFELLSINPTPKLLSIIEAKRKG